MFAAAGEGGHGLDQWSISGASVVGKPLGLLVGRPASRSGEAAIVFQRLEEETKNL
jgi:hypothetical protein